MRWRDAILTLLLWAIFLYLIRGLFIWIGEHLAAAFGWTQTQAYLQNLEPGMGDQEIIETFLWYLVVIAVQTAILIIWAVSNQVRFRGRERRRTMRAVDVEDLGNLYEFPPQEIMRWQLARSMTMTHDSAGKLIETTIADEG